MSRIPSRFKSDTFNADGFISVTNVPADVNVPFSLPSKMLILFESELATTMSLKLSKLKSVICNAVGV